MTVISGINGTWPDAAVGIDQTWPDAIVDIGPIELADHYWGIVGSIPYDGHVVLAVSPTPPSWTAPSS